jgi:hypothetical protein
MLRLAVPALSLLLAACQTAPVEAPRPGVPDLASCGGEPVLALVGRDVAQMPASGDWAALRVIWPGMAVTEDYSESRLNVEVDAQGLIQRVSCG